MLNISIYSLYGSLYSGETETLVLPGLNGDIGVVEGDRVLTYILKPGTIYFMSHGKVTKRFFIFGGRFLAKGNTVTITTEGDCLDLDKITLPDIDDRIEKAKNNVKSSEGDFVKQFYEEVLEAENKLKSSYKEHLY